MARSYGQYCPVALATEILGERWTMLVVVALSDGASRFNDLLRALPRISATMLSQRLRSLEEAGVVVRVRESGSNSGHAYRLTDAGRGLEPIITDLANWGQRWARDLEPDDLDPRFLGWSVHLRMNVEAMPKGRTVLQFEFPDGPRDCRRFWIIVVDGVVDMCIKPPGHAIDLLVTSQLQRFVDVWRGFRPLRAELDAGRIRLEGAPALQRSFPNWLLLSSAAHVERCRPGRERSVRLRAARTKRSR